MTELQSSGAATGTGDRSRPRAVLPALCVTQITSWGILYYAFPVLGSRITADTGWSQAATTAAFSAALLVSAVAGIPIGRILDRRGPRAVMTAGSALGTLALLVIAAAPNLAAFSAGWLLAGLAMAATFYPPAFAALTRWWGPDRVRALTIVTLAGGLASTVFAPLTAALAEHMSWRATYVVLAAILAAVTIPAHALALRAPWPTAPPAPPAPGHTPIPRSRPFLLLAAAFTLSSFAMYAVVMGLIPLLTERGATPLQAALALGLGGAGQTLGRTLYASLSARTSVTTRTASLIALGGATTAALALIPGPVPFLVILAVLAGVVRGNLTLLQATAVTDRWGTAQYGRLSGLLGAPARIAGALAPWAGAALAGPLGGYPYLFAALALLSVVAACLALGASGESRNHSDTRPALSAAAQPNPTAAERHPALSDPVGMPPRRPSPLLADSAERSGTSAPSCGSHT
ncbi:putative major facilitator transporter [Streptomyces scabiei 87.22]|uniref:Putative major facilitator transporter n=10 Tax=Streptomyces TaxID=1883 RepID=C9YZ32_STRSW|nr:MFS transporter [Streptomyces scabiei]MDX2580722.1 MFS transporter [Streptomyces scabiei]MDX2659146.1 MFS transporter [Streptomyces scabiei]MDX2726203.1 MFS transporter [Streptomyces scabiei]MDX2871294.1 MFS transporter [Streptomyces scabiei]MDX2888690.1 MFS transporter [Streptomyces scabiei]